MNRAESNRVLIVAVIDAMKEKLDEKGWKGNITELPLTKAMLRMQEEIVEVAEEFKKADLDYAAIRRELADVINFAGAGIVACDKIITMEKIREQLKK